MVMVCSLSGTTTPATYKSIASLQRETTLIEDYLLQVDLALNNIRSKVAGIFLVETVVELLLQILRMLLLLDANFRGISSQLSGNYKHFCAGTIINANYVLTTGHCVSGRTASTIRVKVGVSDWGDSTTLLTVAEIRPHLNYSDSNYYADLALLKMSDSLVFNGDVQAAIMPQSLNPTDFNAFQSLSTQGDIFSFDTTPTIPAGGKLLTTHLQFTAYSTCAISGVSDPDYHMCAKSSTAGICIADEGAPVLVDFNGQEIIYAITLKASFNDNSDDETCDAINQPVMFLKMSSLHVTYYLVWQT
ncbi:trypsin alpha-like [Atheta coriaria]|uniref:trypsin alpha-like n=1 Tax=Dalotia coriaria TaxID=877792 RepID=UPI0031F421DF